jgi:hypothetical protein
MASLVEEPKTDYLSRMIPKVTGFHPIIKKKYQEKADSWWEKKFLETPYLSDQTKISGIKYFKPETGKMLEEGVNAIRKADQFTTNVGNKVTSFGNKATDLGNKYMALSNSASREQNELYNLHSQSYGGKKYKRTRKNKRTRKSRKNKKKYTSKKH